MPAWQYPRVAICVLTIQRSYRYITTSSQPYEGVTKLRAELPPERLHHRTIRFLHRGIGCLGVTAGLDVVGLQRFGG
jgi:hypothetical protein